MRRARDRAHRCAVRADGDRRDPAEPPMTDWQEVSLLGGPFDGQVRSVDRARNMFTDDVLIGWKKELYGGVIYDVPQKETVSYRRISDTVFQHCRTPTAMGDTENLDLPERQLGLEDD